MTQLAKLFQDHHCVCVHVYVALYLSSLEDVNLFFVVWRQVTCRQMEALHIVAVNIIASYYC